MITSPKNPTTDIAIVGAGLVGLSIALCLQKLGVSIQMLEKQLPDFSANNRPISLSYGSYRILDALGIWEALKTVACPILSVHVSEQGRLGVTHFSAQEQKVPALGYVVPFSALQAALYHHVSEQPSIQFIAASSIDAITRDNQHTIIHYQKANAYKKLQTALLIAADGTQSTCRDLLHIDYTENNSGDVACIYQLKLSDNHTHTAYERFTQFGVLAVLPLHNKKTAQLVWTLTPRLLKKIADWNHDAIVTFFKTVFEKRIDIIDAKKTVEFPLKTVIAKNQTTEGAVLLGNAAHTIYPVAAQGFNLALQDCAMLYEHLKNAQQNHQQLGDQYVLKKYEAAAKNHQEKIFSITHQWVSLFELPFIGVARGLGLLITDILSPLKNKLAKRTMGIADRLPALLRRAR